MNTHDFSNKMLPDLEQMLFLLLCQRSTYFHKSPLFM